MDATGVLAAAIPEGAAPLRVAHLPPDPVLRMAALLTGDRAAFAARLKLSLAETARLLALQGPPPDGDDDAAAPPAGRDRRRHVLIGRSLLAGQPEAIRDRIARACRGPSSRWKAATRWRWACRPARRSAHLLRDVRAWWLAGGCVARPGRVPGRTGEARRRLLRAAPMDATNPAAPAR